MAGKARQYKPSDIKKLFAVSGNQCANPSCTRSMISDDFNNVLGEIAHICAASSEGPRYDASMTDDERRSFNNLILLCDEHHKEIDNPDTVANFPAAVIQEWKQNHGVSQEGAPVIKEEQLDELVSKMSISAGGDIHFGDQIGGDKVEGDKTTVSHSKNVNTGNVNTGGGDFIIGDGN